MTTDDPEELVHALLDFAHHHLRDHDSPEWDPRDRLLWVVLADVLHLIVASWQAEPEPEAARC